VEATNDAQTVWVNTACGKEHSQKNLSKPILWYCNVYNQITSDVWETDNPVHKPTTDKLPPVIINVLIRAIQGSVVMRLRCDGIFSDHSVWKSVQQSYGQE